MKRVISFLLIIAVIFAFTSCGTSKTTETEDPAKTNGTQTSDVNTEDPEPVKDKDWKEEYYVDDFNEPTDQRYITVEEFVVGVFSDGVTTDSPLNVDFAIDEERVSIFLYEYGKNPVKNPSSTYNDDYTITLRNESGKEANLAGVIYPGGDRINIRGEAKETFIDYLCGDEEFKVFIVYEQSPTTKYLFNLSPSNFAELY